MCSTNVDIRRTVGTSDRTQVMATSDTIPAAGQIGRDEVVTQLLAEASELLQQPAVHKSTLLALLAAAAEDPEADPVLTRVVRVPKADLNDALLALRSMGQVQLTADGFTLTSRPSEGQRDASSERLAGYLERLVGRKMREWHVEAASA